MSNYRRRLRSRITPTKSAGLFTVGNVFIEDGPNTNKWVNFNTLSGVNDAPFIDWEQTFDESHGRAPL